VLAKLKCETTLQSSSCSLETTCLVGRFACMGVVGLKHKELAPAECTVAEKQFAKQSDHLQHPNLPAIGYTQSVLMRNSRGCDSFTKDTLLSASD